MSAETVGLGLATVVVIAAAAMIFRSDLRNDPRPRGRAALEAMIPLVGVSLLLWWSWAAL